MRMHTKRLALLWVLVAFACATRPEPEPKPAAARPKGESVVHEGTYTDIQRGPGADYCKQMDQASDLMKQGHLAEAEPLVDTMLAQFGPMIEKEGGIPVSVANQEQFNAVRDASDTPDRLVALDWCYRELLHWKAFIKAGQEDYPAALRVLDDEVRSAPTAAAPYVERGYILNRMGRSAEAKRSYEHALEIAEKYAPSSPDVPVALRGLGYSLIELGDLDAAEIAFNKSLMVEPGNQVAQRELGYIRQLRAKAQ